MFCSPYYTQNLMFNGSMYYVLYLQILHFYLVGQLLVIASTDIKRYSNFVNLCMISENLHACLLLLCYYKLINLKWSFWDCILVNFVDAPFMNFCAAKRHLKCQNCFAQCYLKKCMVTHIREEKLFASEHCQKHFTQNKSLTSQKHFTQNTEQEIMISWSIS